MVVYQQPPEKYQHRNSRQIKHDFADCFILRFFFHCNVASLNNPIPFDQGI